MRLLLLAGLLLPLAAILHAAPVPKEKPSFEATLRKSGDTFRHVADDKSSFFEIVCPSGIGGAVVKRKSGDWPSPLTIRFAGLKGLEKFSIQIGKVILTAESAVRKTPYLFDAKGVPVKEPKDAAWTLTVTGSDKGMEVQIETKIDLAEIKELKLEWIDFFRG